MGKLKYLKLGKDYYRFHKKDAAARKITFLLTYEEWCRIWIDSGHAHEKGCRRGQYVMARFGDKGPYAVGNVRIVTTEQNHAEQWERPEYANKMSAVHKNKKYGPATRQKIREARLNTTASAETRAKMSESQKGNQNAKGHQSWLGRHHKEETKQLIREKNLGKKASLETRAKQSARLVGNQHAKGMKHTPEGLASIGAATKLRWERYRAEKAKKVLEENHAP